MKKTTFLENGQFYKGNIHCHTTCSDGKLSPDAIVKAYQDKGYDFLAITMSFPTTPAMTPTAL